jgi:hypothetical protein
VDESAAPDAQGVADRTISRRTVIRTAVHAAWAVPVISAVSAAPAFAGSLDVFEIVSSVAQVLNGKNDIRVTLTLRNPTNVGGGVGLPATPTVIFSTFTAPAGATLKALPIPPPAGWKVIDDMPFDYKLEYESTIGDGANDVSVAVTFPFATKPKNGDIVTVSGTVSVPNFTPNTKSFSATATA